MHYTVTWGVKIIFQWHCYTCFAPINSFNLPFKKKHTKMKTLLFILYR